MSLNKLTQAASQPDAPAGTIYFNIGQLSSASQDIVSSLQYLRDALQAVLAPDGSSAIENRPRAESTTPMANDLHAILETLYDAQAVIGDINGRLRITS